MSSSTQEPSENKVDPNGANPESQADGSAAGTDVAKLTAERNELNDRLLRLAAEFENYKRRVRKEMDDNAARSLEGLLKEMLPPIDNLDRALAAARANEATSKSALIEGVQMVQKQFLAALEKFQIKSFEAQGQPFDPNFHEAVQQVDNASLPPNTVATVFQRGYFIGQNNRLLRPAVVAVVRPRPQSSADDKNVN